MKTTVEEAPGGPLTVRFAFDSSDLDVLPGYLVKNIRRAANGPVDHPRLMVSLNAAVMLLKMEGQ